MREIRPIGKRLLVDRVMPAPPVAKIGCEYKDICISYGHRIRARRGSMEHLLAALRAVAEPTRLRLIVLCARGELTVSELTQLLGQSQPRVSRHLKLLCEAGLLDRFREGSWVFYRLSSGSAASALSRHLVAACDDADPTIALDLQRLDAIKRQRADLAI